METQNFIPHKVPVPSVSECSMPVSYIFGSIWSCIHLVLAIYIYIYINILSTNNI